MEERYARTVMMVTEAILFVCDDNDLVGSKNIPGETDAFE